MPRAMMKAAAPHLNPLVKISVTVIGLAKPPWYLQTSLLERKMKPKEKISGATVIQINKKVN